MNRKQKIIVSVTGIFLVLLILVGLTYAYFLTQITGNTNDKSISVTTANLQLLYIDGDNIILDENTKLKPSNTPIGVKTFSVYNDGDSVVEDYNIYLEDVVNELNRKDDLVYTLTCESDDEENSPCTNQIINETTFPSTNGTILKNSIAPLVTHTYTLTLTYKEMNVDQSIDMDKYVNAKVNIYDNNDIDKRLSTIIMNDTRIVKNPGTPEFTGVETNEVGMYSAPDDYGESWYFRGAQQYNYVNFAGFTWRIVRINGDGSIRLILDGTLDKVTREGETTVAGAISSFNRNYKGNAYMGYMMGVNALQELPSGTVENTLFTESICLKTVDGVITKTSDTELTCASNGGEWTSPYDATHMNINDSIIKDAVDKFYEEYIENDMKNYHYGEYLSDTLFCGDKSLADTSIGENNTGLGYGHNVTFYAASERLYYENSMEQIIIATPTLECAKGEANTYSRYTANSNVTTKGVNVNSDLEYPIALLSADELVMAGAFAKTENANYYLLNSNLSENGYWTMTPLAADHVGNAGISGHNMYDKKIEGVLRLGAGSGSQTSIPNPGVRPVINLKRDIIINGGDGTNQLPYKLAIID